MKTGSTYFFDHVSILNLKTHETTQVKLNNESVNYRYGHSACLYEENQIIIFGGKSSKSILNETLIIDIRENPDDNCNIID